MHGTALAGTQWTRRTAAGRLRTRALKNGLPRHGTAGCGTHGPGRSARLCNRRDRPGRRGLVHRTRPGLRNDHAWRRRLRRARNCRWRSGTRCSHRSLRSSRCGDRRRSRRNGHRRRRRGTRQRRNRRRNWSLDRNLGRSCGRSRLLHYGSNRWRPHRWRRHWSCRSRNRGRGGRWRWSCHRWRSNGFSHDCWRNGGSRARRRHYFFLLRDGFQHISRPGDMRQIDLGLDFFFAAQRTRGPRRRRLRFGRAAEVHPHLFRFMLLERTGMGLLLRHPDEW
jgi:hypothetical protein